MPTVESADQPPDEGPDPTEYPMPSTDPAPLSRTDTPRNRFLDAIDAGYAPCSGCSEYALGLDGADDLCTDCGGDRCDKPVELDARSYRPCEDHAELVSFDTQIWLPASMPSSKWSSPQSARP